MAVLCLYFICILFAAKGNGTAYKAGIAVFVTVIFIVVVFLFVNVTGLIIHFQTHETMTAWIKSLGGKVEIMYITIQYAQVVFLPIPSLVIILTGTMLFGPFKAALLSLTAVMLGSMTAFLIGRLFGKKIAAWIIGKEPLDKYMNMAKGKDKIMLTAMFVLPFFPDDTLCILAGLTLMSFKYFFVMTLLTRTVAVFATAYIGSGNVIPYQGWGLAVWAGIIVIVSVLLVVLWRNADKIQEFTRKKFDKKK